MKVEPTDDNAPGRHWALLATALTGQALQVRVVHRACPAWAGSAEAGTVDLPASPTAGGFPGWRLAVLRHAMDLQADGRWSFRHDVALALGLVGPRPTELMSHPSDVERCLASWPRPVLLRRLWFRLDRQRVDAQIHQRYPGARAALSVAVAWPEAGEGWPAALLQVVQAGVSAASTVYDSLRAALAWCAWLEAARPGRQRRRPAPGWTVTEIESDIDGPAGASTGRGRQGPQDGGDADDNSNADPGLSSPDCDMRAGLPEGGPASPGSVAPPTERAPVAAVSDRSVSVSLPRPAQVDVRRHRHDEWDYQLQHYRRGWTCVHERQLPAADLGFLHDLRQRHAALALQIRRRFNSAVPTWRSRVRRSPDGDQLDLDAAVALVVNRRAGLAPDGRVYIAHPPAQRDVCAALLLDMSGSTGFAIPDPSADAAQEPEPDEDFFFHAPPRRPLPPQRARRRVIDVARDAIGLMCEGLHGLGDRHAVFGFTGQGREQVDFHVAKPFDSAWSAHTAARLAAMQPGGATRTGAAIRHALLHLSRQPSRRKVLIVVTDGYPQDSDYGPDPADIDYGLHDTARSLREAARAGVDAFCISVDGAAHDHLRRMCPPQRYLVIDDVNDLPQRLVAVYRRLTAR